MKILYVASTVSHLERFHMPYIAALRDEGHTVLTMARGEEADFPVPFEKSVTSAKNLANVRRIRRILRAERFDAILLNTSLAAFLVRLALPKKDRPRVVNLVHGYLFSGQDPRTVRDRVLLACERTVRGKTDALILMNREDAEIAEKYRLTSGPRLFCRGMGVSKKTPDRTAQEVREQTGCGAAPVLAFVGELSPRKNQMFLLDVLARVRKTLPDAVLFLVGDGAEHNALSQRAKELSLTDAVRLLGPQKNPADFVAAADLYVTASRIEGLPFNIVEAMLLGKTVLASDIKGHRDVITHGVSGYLLPPGDAERFAAAAIHALCHPDALQQEDILRAAEKYTAEAVFPETYAVIREGLTIE